MIHSSSIRSLPLATCSSSSSSSSKMMSSFKMIMRLKYLHHFVLYLAYCVLSTLLVVECSTATTSTTTITQQQQHRSIRHRAPFLVLLETAPKRSFDKYYSLSSSPASASSKWFLTSCRGGAGGETGNDEKEIPSVATSSENSAEEIIISNSTTNISTESTSATSDTMSIGSSTIKISSTEAATETILAEEEDNFDVDDDTTTTTEAEAEPSSSLIFAASKPGDGSESDPDGIPTRFINMQKGNREKAKVAFEQTLKWRKDNNVDTILQRPQPKFDLCKKIFPVYIPGRDQQGNIVVVQRIGLIDTDYATEMDVNGDELLWYYIYIVEYCWNIVEPNPFGVMTTVLDLEGVRFKTFRDSNIREFIRKFVSAMSDNYPNRSHKTLVINAPGWINAAYNLVKPLLRSSTKAKISISNGGKKQDQLLIDTLGMDHVPRELLQDPTIVSKDENSSEATTTHVLSEIEKDMRDLCLTSLEKNDLEMLAVA